MNEIEVKTTKSVAIKFGVLYGVLMIIGFLLVYILQVNPNENPMIGRFVSVSSYFILPIILIFFGIKNYNQQNKIVISLSDCLKTGVSITFVGAMVFAVFTGIFNMVNPEYLDQMMLQTKQIIIQQNPKITAVDLENQMALSRKFSSPILSIPFTLLLFSFLGLLYSLIIGLIVRNQQSQSR